MNARRPNGFLILSIILCGLPPTPSDAGTTVFFDPSQVASLVSTGTTSDTISCEGYLFTYTRDKLFTGGVGLTNPIGRPVRVFWPDGVEAQYVTAGPSPGKATITISRQDGALFDLTFFTALLLANAGAGRAIEIVPLLNGEEPLDNPLYFDVSGNAWASFSYDTNANPWGCTATLTNYDAYKVTLTLDYALTALTLYSDAPNPNHAPLDVELSTTSVWENDPAGTMVGTLAAVDPDAGDVFTYGLVAGAGDTHNGSFTLSDGALVTAASFNHELQSNLSIRVEAADQGGLATQRVFVIQVLDVAEPPPAFTGQSRLPDGRIALQWAFLANHRYTVSAAPELNAEYAVVQSNLFETGSYTDAIPADTHCFWQLGTDP